MANPTLTMLHSSDYVNPRQLIEWCRIPVDDLPSHPSLRVPYQQVADSEEMGRLMAEELAAVIEANTRDGVPTRAIIPCGPKCWYAPFAEVVNRRSLSLQIGRAHV